jgi:hypothetical protein
MSDVSTTAVTIMFDTPTGDAATVAAVIDSISADTLGVLETLTGNENVSEWSLGIVSDLGELVYNKAEEAEA